MNLLTLAYRLAVQNVKYGQIRLPLAKRILKHRNLVKIANSESALGMYRRNLYGIPPNLPQPPKRPETPRSELYDAPNLPKPKSAPVPPKKMV